jgi:glycosyltransferase involved in cell wall biosynthesis
MPASQTRTGRPLRVVVVTGIFPPDIGGPATHAADLADELRARGHLVKVVTAADERSFRDDGEVVRVPRRWSWPVRDAAVVAWIVRNRPQVDVVYATGMQEAAVAGARLVGLPVVVKVVGDPAWERGRRLGLTEAEFDGFQAGAGGGTQLRLMRSLRDWSVTNATAVAVPGSELRGVVAGWAGGTEPDEIRLIPNGVRVPAAAARTAPAAGALRAVYVGRLIPHKHVDVLVDAVCATPGVTLDVIGEGPSAADLEARARARDGGDRVRFVGVLDHGKLLERLAGYDVLLNASSYEGLPHVAIEALACGTPLAISAVGGTADVLVDGTNGVLVDPSTAEAFAGVLTRLRDDPDELARLAAGARVEGDRWRFDGVADRIESLLREVVDAAGRPAAVFVGKGGIPRQADGAWFGKLDVLARHLDATIVSPAPAGPAHVHGVALRRVPVFRPRPVASALFYGGGALVGAGIAARRRGVVVCQSPFEAAAALAARRVVPARRRPRLVLEVHGDWRTAARLYGSPARRLLGPASDRVARWAVRHADRVRAVGEFTAEIARDAGYTGDIDRFMTYSDWRQFLERDVVPVSPEPRIVFVGALEPYKAPEILLDAWARVVRTVPDAHLALVGAGPMRARLEGQAAELGLDGSVEFCGALPPELVIDRLDGARCMVLPSRSEGVPRVVLEAMARARAVVGARAGGTPELLEDGVTGLLVPPDDPDRLADALVQLLVDRDRADAMGAEGRRRALQRDPVAEYDAGTARLAAWIKGSGSG